MNKKTNTSGKDIPLNTNTIPTLPEGIYRYERGLYLRVTKTGRFWLLKYTINGRRREMGLGSALDQNVSSAVAKAARYRAMIVDGIDPLEKIAEKREERKKEEKKAKMPTFEQYAPKTIERIFKVRIFTNKKTEKAWRSTVNQICNTDLGKRRIDTITRDDVFMALDPLWRTQPRKARDWLNRLNGIFNFAKSDGLIEKNPAEWKGCLDALLPPMGKVRSDIVPEKHHAALAAEDLRDVVQTAWSRGDVHSLAIVFGALTVGRANEYISGLWDEVDFDEKTFSVPRARRKDKKNEPFVVPLSRQALILLERLDTSSKFLFSSQGGGNVAERTVLNRLKSFTDRAVTLHGMRSTFSDWCARNEKNFVISEKCLMHAVGNRVFQAYQRDDLLEQRRKLMQEWADFLLPNVG